MTMSKDCVKSIYLGKWPKNTEKLLGNYVRLESKALSGET